MIDDALPYLGTTRTPAPSAIVAQSDPDTARRSVLWQASIRRVNYLRSEIGRADVQSVPDLHTALRRELSIMISGADLTGRGVESP